VMLSLGGSTQFPRIRTDLTMVWTYEKTFGGPSVTTEPSLTFDSVQLDLGSFVSGFLKPVLVKVDQAGLKWGMFFSVVDPERSLRFRDKLE